MNIWGAAVDGDRKARFWFRSRSPAWYQPWLGGRSAWSSVRTKEVRGNVVLVQRAEDMVGDWYQRGPLITVSPFQLYYVEVKIFCYSTFLEGSPGNIQRWLDHSGRVASYIHPRDSAILFKIQLLIKRRWRVVKGKRGELLKFIIFAGFSSRLQLISKLCPSV